MWNVEHLGRNSSVLIANLRRAFDLIALLAVLRGQRVENTQWLLAAVIVVYGPSRPLRIGWVGNSLTNQDANHLQAFVAGFQVLNFGLFEDCVHRDDLVQLAIVDMIGLHVVCPSWLIEKIPEHLEPPQVNGAAKGPKWYV